MPDADVAVAGLLVRLPPEDRLFLRQCLRTRRGLSKLVANAVRDLRTLFDLPRPIASLLERDRTELGLTSNRDYVLWLLMERYKACADGVRPEVR